MLSLAGGVDDTTLPYIAHEAHKSFQGGQGSGYDIFTSFHGGIGLFSGGGIPEYERILLSWLPDIYVRSFDMPVRSGSAVGAYNAWKIQQPEAYASFFQSSNRTAKSFARSSSWMDGEKHLLQAKHTGLQLGDAIGVSAETPHMSELPDGVVKSLGAGNETAAYFSPDMDLGPPWTRVSICNGGLTWH